MPYRSVNPATGVLRSGHTDADKIEMLKQLWSTFEDLTGIPTDQLAISLQEIPSSMRWRWDRSCQPSVKDSPSNV
jgi:hypothetical protein